MGFLVLGHTHEDIDGNFGYLSKKLREKNNCVNGSDESIYGFIRTAIHSPIDQKIPDFKSWVQGYLKDGLEVFVGHINMHLF